FFPVPNMYCNASCVFNNQAVVFMHELGHNMGLGHGGGDGVNRKPNYYSVMNYNYGQDGLYIGGNFGHFDYSPSVVPALDENHLNELTGVPGSPAGFGTAHLCGGVTYVLNANGPINWDCVGGATSTNVPFDVNGEGGLTMLNGFNDWPAMKFMG